MYFVDVTEYTYNMQRSAKIHVTFPLNGSEGLMTQKIQKDMLYAMAHVIRSSRPSKLKIRLLKLS